MEKAISKERKRMEDKTAPKSTVKLTGKATKMTMKNATNRNTKSQSKHKMNDSNRVTGNQLADLINRRVHQMEEDLLVISKRAKKCPVDSQDQWVDVQIRNGSARFYQSYYDKQTKERVRKYLPKAEKAQAELLAQQTYDRQVLKLMEQEWKALTAAQKSYAQMTEFYEDVYEKLGAHRQALVTPVIPTAQQKMETWLAKPYPSMTKYAESANYLTEQGEYVRSKSELMIADRLYHAGLPYKYECPLEIPQELRAESGKASRFYPDFTIYLPEQEKELYWEHFGLMSDADYLAHAISKLSFYQRVGLLQSGQLILTFEAQSTNLDPKEITEIIERIRN